MTEIENTEQAITKAKEYLVNPIGVAQAIIDDGGNYDQYKDEPKLKNTTEGEAWIVKLTGYWGAEKFKKVIEIHIKKSDGELLYWRNCPDPKDKDGHGALGWQKEKKYWVG
jgi:hypothetical protein